MLTKCANVEHLWNTIESTIIWSNTAGSINSPSWKTGNIRKKLASGVHFPTRRSAGNVKLIGNEHLKLPPIMRPGSETNKLRWLASSMCDRSKLERYNSVKNNFHLNIISNYSVVPALFSLFLFSHLLFIFAFLRKWKRKMKNTKLVFFVRWFVNIKNQPVSRKTMTKQRLKVLKITKPDWISSFTQVHWWLLISSNIILVF